MASTFHRYVALGDSFTEGVGDHDPTLPNGVRGWADRVAEGLAARTADFGYANLAIRGRKMDAILAEQVEPALALRPDLVSVYAGGNDILRPKVSIDALVQRYDAAVAPAGRLRGARRALHRLRPRLRTGVPAPARTRRDLQRAGPRGGRHPRRDRRGLLAAARVPRPPAVGRGPAAHVLGRSPADGDRRPGRAGRRARPGARSTSRRCRRWTAASAATPTWPGPGRTPRRGCSAGSGARRPATRSRRAGPGSRPSYRRASGEPPGPAPGVTADRLPAGPAQR